MLPIAGNKNIEEEPQSVAEGEEEGNDCVCAPFPLHSMLDLATLP